MPDRRRNKIKLLWINNGLIGKIIVVVVAGFLLSLIGTIISIPVIYETKSNATVREIKCVEKLYKIEKRTCEKIMKLESLHEKDIKDNQETIKMVRAQMQKNAEMLQRIDERTIRMDRRLP